MLWTAIFAALGVAVLFAILKYKKAHRYWPDRGIHLYTPPGSDLVDLIKQKFDFVKNETRLYEAFKGKKYGGVMEFVTPTLYVTDLDLMKQIYIKDFDHFINRRRLDLGKTDPHWHYSLFNQEGEAWKNLRTKMSPTFTTGKIRRMFAIFNSSAKKLTKALADQISGDQIVEMKPFIQKLTMDVIASAAFGVQSNLFEDPDSAFARNAMRIQDTFSGKNISKLIIMGLFPKIAQFFKLKLFDDKADQFLSKVIIDALNHRQKTGEKREDFLQLMLEARLGQLKQEDENDFDDHEKNAQLKEDGANKSKLVFTDDLIIAQCLAFFLAGFDNTESIVTFALYELAINPEVQEKLYEEVKQPADENNGEFNYDVMNEMEYLEMVVQETLRKYPAALRTDRKCTRPYKLPETDLVVPKDMIVTIPIYPVHHDPEYWPNPETFDPERFTKENSSKRHPYAFAPFGHGPRNCIGNRFVLAEAKAAIAHLVLNFCFEPCEKTTIPMVFASSSSLKPVGNTPLRLKPRF